MCYSISNALWLNLIPLLNFLCWLAFSIKELRLDWILSGYTKHLLNIFMLLLSPILGIKVVMVKIQVPKAFFINSLI
ncbi:hypothetical protein NQZ68_023647 [Dissostichus eleginoides]|nr:hypothetical protein NQZ68_023647 [Dissostichus eleginoides]